MSLREIDSKRVDGKFVDAEGNKVSSPPRIPSRFIANSAGARTIRPSLPPAPLSWSSLSTHVGIRTNLGRAHANRKLIVFRCPRDS